MYATCCIGSHEKGTETAAGEIEYQMMNRSVHEVAEYTKIYIGISDPICRETIYPETLWSHNCWILQLLWCMLHKPSATIIIQAVASFHIPTVLNCD
jgi:hypothetical protein